jgi:F-box protein, helicase, 18
MKVLESKTKLHTYIPMKIIGAGKETKTVSKAIIGRTNLGLLLKAITYITDNRKVKYIYFEGNFNSYTYASDGASLYDVLNLFNNKKGMIRDELLKTMDSIAELEHYIEQTEDAQLGMMLEVVKEYENEIPALIKKLKDKQVPDGQKEKAEMVFSTVHRCKGMEYDEVELVADFMSEEKLEKLLNKKNEKGEIIKLDTKQKEKLAEEINLLYVAVTRAKKILKLPQSLLPFDVKASASIQIIATEVPSNDGNKNEIIIPDYGARNKMKKSNTIIAGTGFDKKRETHANANMPWTDALDKKLEKMYDSSKSFDEMATEFGSTKGAIMSRLRKLELID